MKTLVKSIALLIIALVSNISIAQTIAVGPINTYGVFMDQTTATTMTRLELIKLKKYQVLDQFDMAELDTSNAFDDCYGRTCLMEMGKDLGTDFILSGKIDGLGPKIIVSLKLIDINGETIAKTHSHEFDNQEIELQRMVEIVLKEMHGEDVDEEVKKRLSYENELITSNRVNNIRNSGPRIGMGYAFGTMGEFLTRSEANGGYAMKPIMTNIGYQLEAQYVGTENFSALFEGLFNISGLEQGKFIPSLSLMNGFRFGKGGWEIALGPSFGLIRTREGFFDTEGVYGDADKFWSKNDFHNAGHTTASLEENDYYFKKIAHKDGDWGLSTRWIIAAGRTFRHGALNVPVNVYYMSMKGGGSAGISVGFNITRSKKKIKN